MVETPPEIPHITTNIIPLSQILTNFTNFAYSELHHVISIQPNDEQKKKKLLELIVYLRQEFVRLYVLTKWSKISSHEFTLLIDLLSWLREQTSYFTNLIWSTKALNQSLISAKLPNPDLITALEVFKNGKPILPSHNYFSKKNLLTNKKILKVLKDLNIITSIKFAMIDNIPKSFLQNYEIKNGRIYITSDDYNFQLSTLDENSPFKMISFQFNENNDLIPSSTKLKKIANEVLKTNNFIELEKILVNFNNTMKLYILHHKLNSLKNIKHQYHPEKFQIILNYWINSYVFKNSYIEIGLNKSNELVYKWYKCGQFTETFKNIQDIEYLLKEIQFKHSQSILKQIDDLYINKSILKINELTGLFYFKNPQPFLNNALKKLNIDDFKNINDSLKKIKLSMRFNDILSILSVTNWFQNDLIKLNNNELKKLLLNPGQENINQTQKHIKFYTRKEWPKSWFLILLVDSNNIRAFIGTIVATSGLYILKNVVELQIGSIDYKNSLNLINKTTKLIFSHLISQELGNAIYKVQDDDEIEEHNDHNDEESVKSGLILIKTDTFIPIPTSSDVVYLRYEIKDNFKIYIQLKGKLNIPKNDGFKLNDFKINDDGVFEIYETLEFRRTELLTNIKSQLTKLSKIIDLIEYLKKENLDLISVKLDEIIFRYDNDQICKLKENFQIEFAPENPHNICLQSIQKYLNGNGIGKLFKYSQNTNKLVHKLKQISETSRTLNMKIESNSSVSNLNIILPKYQTEVISKNLNLFTILYYSPNMTKITSLMIEVKINQSQGYQFFISTDSNFTQFKDEFSFKSPLVTGKSNGTVIPLITGLLCDSQSLEYCIDYFHDKISKSFS